MPKSYGFISGVLVLILIIFVVLVVAVVFATKTMTIAGKGSVITVTGQVVTSSGGTASQPGYQLTNTPTGAVYNLIASSSSITFTQFVGQQVSVTGSATNGRKGLSSLTVQSITLLSTGSGSGGTSLSGIALGVYEPAGDPLSHGTAVDQYTAEVGKKPAFAWFSVKWQNAITGAYQEFDPRLLDQFRTRGIMPGINWDASRGSALNKDQPDFSWRAIASGKHDAYITQTAKAVAAYHYPFIMRVLEEMDGNWYPWGYNANGNTNPADFVAAWKHIVDIFRNEGATNVQFAWCLSAGILTPSRISQYSDVLKQIYPGDDYVDWIALDGYSALATTPTRTLQDVFQPTYQFVETFTHRPMAFYEVGASENPQDPMAKANWITQGFLTAIPTVFPDVKLVNWFDGPQDNGPLNWAVDTSQNSLNAWKQVVVSPLYQGSLLK